MLNIFFFVWSVNVQTVLTIAVDIPLLDVPPDKCCTPVDIFWIWSRRQCWRKISSSVGLPNRTFYPPTGRGARAQRTNCSTQKYITRLQTDAVVLSVSFSLSLCRRCLYVYALSINGSTYFSRAFFRTCCLPDKCMFVHPSPGHHA